MRHGKKFNHLGRKTAHRKAMLSNMACSLIEHKRIKTTVAKAKALRKYVEPLITKSKNDTTHSRRIVFSYLGQKDSITELFGSIASKVANRDGGYTRILRTHNRLGDNAEMCIIELVDYNEGYGNVEKPKKKKKSTRRSSGSKEKQALVETPVVEDAQVVEDVQVVEVVEDVEDVQVVETETSLENAANNTTSDVSEDGDSKNSEDEK